MFLALALALVPAPAVAHDALAPPDWGGLPIAQVSITFPEGTESDDNLQPLLLSRQDSPIDPTAVRRDVATLFRVGQFRAVEADVVRAPYIGPDSDEIVEGVVLTYRAYPAPRVAAVEIGGVRGLKRSEVLDAARISVGQAFYADLDARPAAERVEALYRRRGWPDAACTVTEVVDPDGDLTVVLRVDEGTPRVAAEIVFAGDRPVPRRRLLRWAARAGIREGAPVSAETVREAQQALRARLARLRTFPVQSGGWVEARVTPTIQEGAGGQDRIVFTIEAGRRLALDVDGLTWRPRAKTVEALGIDERTRLTPGFVAGAPERMETWLQERGYLVAKARIALDDGDETRTLAVDVDRGPLHVLSKVEITGNDALDDATLRAVMDQESDTVLRLRRVTEAEVLRTLPAIREVYRAHGHQTAEIAFTGLSFTPRRGPLSWLRREPAVNVRVALAVDEGPLTLLRSLEIAGAAPEVDLAFADARRRELIGGPYSPQALAALAQDLVEAHRAAGYLDADARIDATGDLERDATLTIRAGPRVLLRSVVTRGVARTRASTVRREIQLVLGEPVTSADLDTIRRSLYDLGIFRTVSTELLGDGTARDLVVGVEERPRYAFELGAGVSTDQGFRGFGRVTRRNLWGRAHRIGLYGLLGLDWRSDSLRDWTPDWADPEWRAAITYDAPHFPTKAQRLVVDLLLQERIQERTWQMSRSGLGMALETTVGPTTVRTGVRVEGRRFEQVDPGALLPGEVWNDLLDPADPARPTRTRFQDTVTALLLHDRRDSPFSPTRGWTVTLRGEVAPGLPLVEKPVAFGKAEVRATAYVPVRGFILKLSGDGGLVRTFGDAIVPLEDRLRIGGTGSLRGFRRDTLGPRNEVAHTDLGWSGRLRPVVEEALRRDPTRWTPTGGDTRATASIELVAPLPALGLRAWDGWAAALFLDTGNAWLLADGVDATSEQEPTASIFGPLLRYAVGGGLRVATPVGPLQVDLAANPAALQATGARKALLVQQWDEPLLRAHLSLGTLF